MTSVLAHLRSLLPDSNDLKMVRRYWRQDISAGLTVGIVALPLALAFGVASGVGAEAGLVTAVIAGIVAAIFGGSHVQVSGPTGAMAVILAPMVALHGIEVVPLLSILAGAMVLAFGILGLGRAISLIPWPVIEGFTAGIAVTLFLQQVPNIVGTTSNPADGALVGGFKSLTAWTSPTSFLTLGITGLTVAIIFGCRAISKKIPGSLVAVITLTLVVFMLDMNIPTIGNIPNSLPTPQLPHMSTALVGSLLKSAFAIALLAGIESLLSARVAAGMIRGGSYNPDRELFGQGLASIASGLFGGMPATGAIARTAVNVRSGGRSRFSVILHALVLLAVIYLASKIVSVIPLATLAGVLTVTCYQMINPETIRQINNSTRSDAIIFWITATLTVALDLIWAIVLGIIVSCFAVLRRLANSSGIYREDLPSDPRIAILRIDGTMFFGVGDRIEREIPRLAEIDVVILRLSRVGILDVSGVRSLAQIVDRLVDVNNVVLLKGLPTQVQQIGQRMELDQVSLPEYLFDDMDSALNEARKIVNQIAETRN